MKNKLLVLSLVLSLALVGCGTSETTTVENESVEEVTEEVEETSEDQEEVKAESEKKTDSEVIYDETYNFGTDGEISISWKYYPNTDKYTITHSISSSNLEELAFAAPYDTMWLGQIRKHYDNVSFMNIVIDSGDTSAEYSASSFIGISGHNEDGSKIDDNSLPDWFNKLPDDTSDLQQEFDNIYELESALFTIYLN